MGALSTFCPKIFITHIPDRGNHAKAEGLVRRKLGICGNRRSDAAATLAEHLRGRDPGLQVLPGFLLSDVAVAS